MVYEQACVVCVNQARMPLDTEKIKDSIQSPQDTVLEDKERYMNQIGERNVVTV